MENPLLPGVDVGRSSYNIKRVKVAFEHSYLRLVHSIMNYYARLEKGRPTRDCPGERSHCADGVWVFAP